MAFVIEDITEENRKDFDSIGFTSLNGDPKCGWFWVIDRERNIIMTDR